MGVHGSVEESPLMSYLECEFQRAGKNKAVLYLHQVQQLRPPEDCRLDLRHIPTLWKLDANHDGCITMRELIDFSEFCNERRRALGSLDFEWKLKAQCNVDLWGLVCGQDGCKSFADWVVRLLAQGEEHTTFDFSNEPFMTRDAVMTLYELMIPYQISSHIDQQGFLDMLQQIGEHRELMSLMEEKLDDWVPVVVVHDWIESYIQAYANLFRELRLEPPRPGGGQDDNRPMSSGINAAP